MIGVISILTMAVLTTLNPITQIQKGQDAQRQQDLKQITNALDTYYNDKNYYPTTIPQGGASWAGDGTTVYMKKVPSDPAASNGWKKYAYVNAYTIDGTSSRPQWNVLFAKVNFTPKDTTDGATVNSTACPLKQMGCFPENYTGYNYCVISGSIDSTACQNIKGFISSL